MRGSTNGEGRSGNGHGDGPSRDDSSEEKRTSPEVNEAARTAPPGVVGFFDRALARWYALMRNGGRRMRFADAELIARGARERYMSGRYIDEEESVSGPRNEGGYTYPVQPSAPRAVERRPPATHESAPMRNDERYESPPGPWHRDRTYDGWDPVEPGDRGGVFRGTSSDEGARQWSHRIERDPRADRPYDEREYESPLSLAPYGGRRGAQLPPDPTQRTAPGRTAPPRGRRWGQR